MKIFAFVILSGLVACAYAEDTMLTVDEAKTAAGEAFVGELMETMGGEIVRVGTFEDDAMMPTECKVPAGMPTCKMGTKWGTPVCFMKCMSMGKKGGHCMGIKCMCVD